MNSFNSENEENETRVRVLDINSLVNAWPQSIGENCSFNIEVFSTENREIEPCERSDISTGLQLNCFIPLTHNLYFKGNQFLEHVIVQDKFVLPIGQILKVRVVNFCTESITIRKNAPLGRLILTQNM